MLTDFPGIRWNLQKCLNNLGIQGSFYFRITPESWDEKIIMQIAEMGHEVGYHYEDLGATAQRRNGAMAEEELVKLAIERFKINLERAKKNCTG